MKRIWVLLIVLILLFNIPIEAQCAMCRAVLESEQGQTTAKGVNNGIKFLMLVPYVLMGGLGFLIYKKFKK